MFSSFPVALSTEMDGSCNYFSNVSFVLVEGCV